MHLSLKGLLAMPTIRNAAGIDVLVSTPEGIAADLKVKTAQRAVHGWPTQAPDQIVVNDNDNVFFVFVRWLAPDRRYEGFLVPSAEVRSGAVKHAAAKEARGSKPFHAWVLPSGATAQQKLRHAWEIWSPDGVPRRSLR